MGVEAECRRSSMVVEAWAIEENVRKGFFSGRADLSLFQKSKSKPFQERSLPSSSAVSSMYSSSTSSLKSSSNSSFSLSSSSFSSNTVRKELMELFDRIEREVGVEKYNKEDEEEEEEEAVELQKMA